MNRHDTDVVSLAFGIIFAAVTGWWLLVRWAGAEASAAGWFLAAALIVFGAVGVVTTVRSARRRDTGDAGPEQTARR
jgi:uncharacterized membrane protein HdeD (DUF308 family)